MKDNSFKSLIDEAKSILVLLAENPTFDEVASGLGLYLALRGEKDVSITSPTPMIVSFNRLVGVNKITSETGNKNLILKFKNYQPSNIEKVSYDVINGEFQLSVVPKPGFSAPTDEQIEIKHAGLSSDTVIIVGGETQDQFPLLADKDAETIKIIHVGTAPIKGSRDVISFDRPASSISELVTDLIKQTGLGLDPDIATDLLMGIEEGSDSFASPEVNADTFAAMSDLMRAGGRRVAKREMPDPGSFPAGSIPGTEIEFEKPKEEVSEGEAPTSWMEPKIYKGTSVS